MEFFQFIKYFKINKKYNHQIEIAFYLQIRKEKLDFNLKNM